jgi:DNA helicase-2/ATP-dependent DNA helicase PcrA
MKPDGAGLTVVGDDAQAIYSFRAAASTTSSAFPHQFTPRAEVVTLAQNYRSTQPVLDVANALMAEAPRQYRKHLLAPRGDGRGRAVTVDDLRSQAEYVCAAGAEAARGRTCRCAARPCCSAREPQRPARDRADAAQDPLREVRRAEASSRPRTSRTCSRSCAGPTIRATTLAAFRVLQLLPGMGPVNARKVLDTFFGRGALFASRCAASSRRRRAKLAWPKLLEPAADLAIRSGPGPGSCAWRASGTSRTSSALTSTSTRASATSTSSSCSRAAVSDARALPHRADARPAAVDQRSRRPAAPRRGLPRAVDRALGQGHGVGHRLSC